MTPSLRPLLRAMALMALSILLIPAASTEAQRPRSDRMGGGRAGGGRASVGGREVINPPGISPLVPAYSVAIRDGDWVFVSGMTGVKPGSQEIVDGGTGAQTRQTMTNIKAAIDAAGATMADVAECTVFLVDMADYAAMNSAYMEFFPVNPPARATLAVSALPRPTARVEIKCSARIRRR